MGCVTAYLLKEGRRLTLDDPALRPQECGDYVVVGGKQIRSSWLDLDHATVSTAHNKIGTRGESIEAKARVWVRRS